MSERSGVAEQSRDGRLTDRPWLEWVAWFARSRGRHGDVLVSVRPHLNATYITLAYLLVVQGEARGGGRPLGLALAAAALCQLRLSSSFRRSEP